ncbi:MAG: alpha/beta hydrolase [Acidobacteria bacterium]|nr:MAG: alpha/beta hydrolase [Acidobacteriota bacterium]
MPFVHTGEIRMHYEISGEGRETILFVHGNLASGRWWEKVIAFLPPHRYHTVAPDLRGCGQSDKPETGYTVTEMAGDLRAFAEALHLARFHLVGHSLGGAIALLTCLENPRPVKTLTLVDPVPADGLELPEELFPLMQEMRRNRDVMREGLHSFLPSAPTDGYFEQLVDDCLQCHAACFSDLPRGLAALDFSDRLGELTVPTLIVWGEQDPVIPLNALKRMQERMAHSRLEIFPGVGHAPPVEQPEVFSRLLMRFVENASPDR